MSLGENSAAQSKLAENCKYLDIYKHEQDSVVAIRVV